MGELYIPQSEQEPLRAVDSNLLDKLIDQCMQDGYTTALSQLKLENCGPYVSTKLRTFKTALTRYGAAIAPKKLDQTRQDVRSAGSDLLYAVQSMKHRLETEEKERLLFEIDDFIRQPLRFTKNLTVHVCYKWRLKVEDAWTHGSITFSHDVDLRPNYSLPPPTRKPSAAKQEQDRQDQLFREWEHLTTLGLYSIRDYFREGRSGGEIPEAFKVKTDSHAGALNNFSAKFWLART